MPTGVLSIRACRYNGDNLAVIRPAHPPHALLGEARIDKQADVAGLVRQFDALGPDHGAHSCPDEQIALLLRVRYLGGRRLDVGIDSCLTVSNGSGRHARWMLSDPSRGFLLMARLVRLTGGDPAPWQRLR